VIACAFPGLAPNRAPAAEPTPLPDQAFQKTADEYIHGYLAWRPQTGTALGLHRYDGRLTDYSRESIAAELARLKAAEGALNALATNRLSNAAFYDYRILRASIQREIFAFEQLKVYTRNPMTYASVLDVSVYIKRDFAPLEDRVRSIIGILGNASNVTAAARANLESPLPRPQIETAIEQANGIADFLQRDLVEALKSVTNQVLMAEFRAVNERAIDAMRAYARFLKDEKLPRATDDFALGRKKYSEMLRYGELITLSPEKILEIGLRELARQQTAFSNAAKIIDPAKTPNEVFKAIQQDHPTVQSLIPDTAKDMDVIRTFVINRQIVTIPSSVPAIVAETPQFLRATSFASMDTPGPFETNATQAYYYVTPAETNWPPKQQEEWLTAFNYFTTDVVSIHEAYPGHYVQFLCLNASPATPLEKIFNSYAFVEGWAHYCEQMMLDEGFGASRTAHPRPEAVARAAKFRLAQADEALLRVCRLCVSIKMHCHGMTIEQATKFFQQNCYYEEKPARQEAIRGTFDPEYLYYTVGKLEFLKLREDYRQQEGEKFSLKAFHDEALRYGAPPIRLLRERLLKDPALWDQIL
jgi:uncharacterized protein (DUF885 family)